MSPKLILKHNDKVIKEIELKKSVLIGRETGNIVIKNPAVSAKHARIEVGEGTFTIFDLDSTNGTFVNDQQVTRHDLQDGDVITIGKHLLIFSNPESSMGDSFFDDDLGGQTVLIDKTKMPKDEPHAPSPPPPQKIKPAKEEAAQPPPSAKPAAAVSHHGELLVTTGDQKSIFKLTKETVTIGSGDSADIKVSGFFVGKVAATVHSSDKGVFVTGEGGLSKAKLNGDSISGKVRLKGGDKITVGKTTIEVKM